MRSPRRVLVALLVLLAVVAAACGGDDASSATADTKGAGSDAVKVRLGYFPNITHAPAIIGVLGGQFAAHLPKGSSLQTATFNAGPEAVQALFSGALDLSFVGPNPAINAYAQSHGDAIRIVSGTTSGGASFVVRKGIDSPADLKGTTIATPQLGNTQDVALRAWLADQGLSATDTGAGDVSIKPEANGDALTAFVAGSIDGAWVPEPFATRFVQEGGGHVLVDESSLWPQGRFVTTQLIVRTQFLEDHPQAVKGVIEGLADAIELTRTDPAKAKALTNQGIEQVTGKALSAAVLDASWAHLSFTLDPIASSLQTSAEHAEAAGLLDPVDLEGIYDLDLVDAVLHAKGQPAVAGL
jgi:NitT/TauT family transport system substrate-binding protein